MMDNQVDAIRSPLTFAGDGDAMARLSKLQASFAPILGVARVFVRHQGTEHFITGDPSDTLNYSSESTTANLSRYNWRDRGDGVLYGYFRRGS